MFELEVGIGGKRIGIVQYVVNRCLAVFRHHKFRVAFSGIIGYVPAFHLKRMTTRCEVAQRENSLAALVIILFADIKII